MPTLGELLDKGMPVPRLQQIDDLNAEIKKLKWDYMLLDNHSTGQWMIEKIEGLTRLRDRIQLHQDRSDACEAEDWEWLDRLNNY